MSYDDIAKLYDAAFSWETDPEVILPVWDFCGRPERMLETACGPARMLASLVAAGAHGTGVDISQPMLALADANLRATGNTRFELLNQRLEQLTLREPCGGAFCAVSSFGHLHTPQAAHSHLEHMQRALTPGAVYAVQLKLTPLENTAPGGPNEHSQWEFEAGGERLRYAWYGTGIDAARELQVERSRIEWCSGPRTGEVIEHDHPMQIWDWPKWQALLADTGFSQVAALDPNAGFQELSLGTALYDYPVAWQMLRRRV